MISILRLSVANDLQLGYCRDVLTFCIPVYETPKPYLEKCLKSIYDLNFDDYEILIFDDCSPSNILEEREIEKLINGFKQRIRIFRNKENQGLQVFNVKMIEKIETKYAVIFHHDDWIIDPKFYIESINIMESLPEVKMVIGNSLYESNLEFFYPYLAPFKNSYKKLIIQSNNQVELKSNYVYSIAFDPDFYFKKYRDISQWGYLPIEHFIEHGLFECRQPNLIGDENYYLVKSKKFMKSLTIQGDRRIHPTYSSVVFNLESCLRGGFLTNKVLPNKKFAKSIGHAVDEGFIYLYGLASLGNVVCTGKATSVRGEPKSSFSKSSSWKKVETKSLQIAYLYALLFSSWKNLKFKYFMLYAIKNYASNDLVNAFHMTIKAKMANLSSH